MVHLHVKVVCHSGLVNETDSGVAHANLGKMGKILKPQYFILTGSGIIDLIDPEPHHFNVEEIALVLSRKPRFGGHGLRNTTPVNVAQHQVYVSKHYEDPVIAMLGLFHDSQETASGDASSPLKLLLRDRGCFVVDGIESRCQHSILKMLKLTCGIDLPGMLDAVPGIRRLQCDPIPGVPTLALLPDEIEPAFFATPYDLIHPIDKACAASEALYLFGEHRREEIIECFGMPTTKIEVTPMTQWESEQAFLNRFEYLRLKLESQQSTRATLTTQEDCTERNVALS